MKPIFFLGDKKKKRKNEERFDDGYILTLLNHNPKHKRESGGSKGKRGGGRGKEKGGGRKGILNKDILHHPL